MFKNVLAHLAAAVVFCLCLHAQSSEFTLGGALLDHSSGIWPAADGGYFLSGASYSSNTAGECLVTKLDASLAVQWHTTLGGAQFSQCWGLTPLADSGLVAIGHSHNSSATPANGHIMRIDKSGGVIWERYADFGFGFESLYDVAEGADGSLGVVGFGNASSAAERDCIVLCISPGGSLIWSRRIGGSRHDVGHRIVAMPDSGFVVAGSSQSVGSTATSVSIFVARYGKLGNVLWSHGYEAGLGNQQAVGLARTPDGHLILTGITAATGAGADDAFLLKLDVDGNVLWFNAYGGAGMEEANRVYVTRDHGYLILGETKSIAMGDATGSTGDGFLLKTDLNGVLQWSRAYGGTEREELWGVHQRPDGGFLLSGLTKSYGQGDQDYYLLSTDSLGLGPCTAETGTPITTPRAVTRTAGGVSNPGPPLLATASVVGHPVFAQAEICGVLSQRDLRLSAAPGAGGALLEWTLEAGLAAKSFQVLRGQGVLSPLQTVQGAITHWQDAEPPSGRVHYQVNALLADGSLLQSNVVEVMLEQEGRALRCGPVPFLDELHLQWQSLPGVHATLVVTDLAGRVIQQLSDLHSPALLHTSTWPAGMYLLHLTDGHGVTLAVQRVAKQ